MNRKNIIEEEFDVLVIGGGFFGLYIAEYLCSRYHRVLLCEKGNDFMSRASYANQARVHNGYHYPRSILTAFRSRINYPRFLSEFPECIDSSFDKYYAIGKTFSKVSSRQYKLFCDRIGAFCKPAPESIQSLFSPSTIDAVFQTEECAFDPEILKRVMVGRVNNAGVFLQLNTEVIRIHQGRGGSIVVELQAPDGKRSISVRRLFNCTYAQINQILARSTLPLIPLKHELTEMALVEVPERLKHLGITVMCGPFFSAMPFPPKKLHTLSHVRYTPHFQWYDGQIPYVSAYEIFDIANKQTAFPYMIRDVQRYLPSAIECQYKGSLFEIKTVLPLSEVDDSRPILFKKHFGLRNVHCIMGGKIDNVYDVINEIEEMFIREEI